MQGGDELQRETPEETNGQHSPFSSRRLFELAWLEVRMCWQSVQRTRLDQKKKEALVTLVQHYREAGCADRQLSEFEEVLARLKEEHELRLKELARDERRSRKFQNAVIQIVRDNNAARLQYCRERTEETPPIIAEWKQLMEFLFPHLPSRPEAGPEITS